MASSSSRGVKGNVDGPRAAVAAGLLAEAVNEKAGKSQSDGAATSSADIDAKMALASKVPTGKQERCPVCRLTMLVKLRCARKAWGCDGCLTFGVLT